MSRSGKLNLINFAQITFGILKARGYISAEDNEVAAILALDFKGFAPGQRRLQQHAR